MGKVIIIGILMTIAICMIFLLTATAVKASDVILDIKDMKMDYIAVEGFEMLERGEVTISGIGGKYEYTSKYFAYGWIIDADNRELVWTMQGDCDDEDQMSDYLIECEGSIRLAPGRYEAYYFSGSPNYYFSSGYDIDIDDLGEVISLIGDIFSKDSKKRDTKFEKEDLEELMFTITTDADFRTYTPEFHETENAIVSINQPEANEFIKQGFTLERELDLRVYAIGEYSDSYEVFVDGAWIINASTREKVWTMDKWNTSRAGGATKNRSIRDIIALPPGNYIAYYATDDSHDADEWNSPPPADPLNYGMVLSVVNEGDKRFVSNYDDMHNEVEITRLVRVRDDSFEKAGFTLKEDAKIHIFALGERSYSDDELVDYGWITDMETMDRVWQMDGDNTGYAGGAAKNCQFDGVVELKAGNYMLYYRTDDSHAYGDWNTAAPFDKRSWGISIFGVGNDFSEDDFELVDQFQPGGKVLVDLTGLGNYEEISRSFMIEKNTRVRVMALGEGKSRVMYDYGWIENKRTGEVVWEMTYRKTRHAGGASKNRFAVANLTLEKGEYTAFFLTDDSHSLERFNASPPDEPERWGLIVTLK
ncbi:MAG: hypothetical protein KAR42_14425 [candidate division Zixibacteria bacterium]|nr:hypothetical protein [candidate division Zixibacteria bacterium]